MKKYLLVAAMAVSTLLSANSMSFAENIEMKKSPTIQKIALFPDGKQAPHEFNKKRIHTPPSKEEMAEKKAEFEKRLNLTEEQKQQIAENKKQDIEKMKPVFEEMKAKRHAMRAVDFDATLSTEQKQAKKEELKSEMKTLKETADNYRAENMKKFESILDDKQKKEFKKIQEEQKKEMEKRREQFRKIKKDRKEYHLPVQPKPIPLEK